MLRKSGQLIWSIVKRVTGRQRKYSLKMHTLLRKLRHITWRSSSLLASQSALIFFQEHFPLPSLGGAAAVK